MRVRQGRGAVRNSMHLALMSFTVAFTFLSVTPIVAAEPKDEIEAAAAAWAQALGEDDPDKVLPLYSSDAVLWGDRIAEAAVRSGSTAGLFRGCLQGSFWPEGCVRRSPDPCIWKYGGQHGLLHVLVCAER